MQNVNQYDDCRVDIDFMLNIESQNITKMREIKYQLP